MTMDRLGGCVQAPMNMTTLGCFSRCISDTSALKSCNAACTCHIIRHKAGGLLKVILVPKAAPKFAFVY